MSCSCFSVSQSFGTGSLKWSEIPLPQKYLHDQSSSNLKNPLSMYGEQPKALEEIVMRGFRGFS